MYTHTPAHACAHTHTQKHTIVHHSPVLSLPALSCTSDLTWTLYIHLCRTVLTVKLFFFLSKTHSPESACQASVKRTCGRYADCFWKINTLECSVDAEANQHSPRTNSLHQDGATPESEGRMKPCCQKGMVVRFACN